MTDLNHWPRNLARVYVGADLNETMGLIGELREIVMAGVQDGKEEAVRLLNK